MALHVIDTVLLKVASRCNLNCRYCYVYHMGDDGWRDQPKLMSDTVQAAIIGRLAELHSHQQHPMHIVLHGGEPLLIGPSRMRRLCQGLRNALPPPCEVHVQTNGLLLTDAFIDIFVDYDVGISISLDGPPDIHNQHRVDHQGRGSHERVCDAINRLTARHDARPLFSGMLAVIDPKSSAKSVYASLKAAGAPSIDFLVRDGNHSCLPCGKASTSSTEYGSWLIEALDEYLRDPSPPRVRLFDDLLRLILGGQSCKEGVGTTDYGILVIETNGTINKNDTLKVAHNGADRFDGANRSILTDSLLDVIHSPGFESYYRQQQPTAQQCRTCPELHICGGGMVAHRWSAEGGFDNPSIFCADQLALISRMRQWLSYREAA